MANKISIGLRESKWLAVKTPTHPTTMSKSDKKKEKENDD
jgi:hypothetical protein